LRPEEGRRLILIFRIRPEHLQRLAEQQAESFTARMTMHLREMFSAEVEQFDDAALALIVRKGCEMAEGWRIEEEPHVERFLELLVSFPHLRRKPLPQWVTAIVADPKRPPVQILCMLEEHLLYEARA